MCVFIYLLFSSTPCRHQPDFEVDFEDQDTFTEGIISRENVGVEFKKQPIQAYCGNCDSHTITKVESNINGRGLMWAILCCFCGVYLCSWGSACMDGFREFNHYCHQCGGMIASYIPKFTIGSIIFLILLTFLAMGLVGYILYRMFEGA